MFPSVTSNLNPQRPSSFNFDQHITAHLLQSTTHMTAMNAPWHPNLTTLFEGFSQPQFANDQNAYYRPYATLFYKLFDVGGGRPNCILLPAAIEKARARI